LKYRKLNRQNALSREVEGLGPMKPGNRLRDEYRCQFLQNEKILGDEE